MRINERVMGECTFDEWVLCAFFGDKAITPVANNVDWDIHNDVLRCPAAVGEVLNSRLNTLGIFCKY